MPRVTLMELDGRIALKTPVGTLVFDGVAATRLATAMEQQARWGCAKESGDPDRQRQVTFSLYEIIDPDPGTEHGGNCSAQTRKGSGYRDGDSGSGAGGGA